MFGIQELNFLKGNAISLDEFRLKLGFFDVMMEDVVVAGELTGLVVRDVSVPDESDPTAEPKKQSFCFSHDDFLC